MSDAEQPSWDTWTSTATSGRLAGREWTIRSTATPGPPVILLHELFGPDQDTMELARWLAVETGPRFAVHVPALLGRHGHRSGMGEVLRYLCIRREITVLRTGRTSPVVSWLRQFAAEVSVRHDGGPVGVIGMCMTGNLVMGLVTHPAVGAAVASQPAMPAALWRKGSAQADMGLSPQDVPPADGSGTDLTVLRYASDDGCPRQRAEAIAGTPLSLPVVDTGDERVAVAQGTRGRLVEVAGSGHSVLTADLNERARDLVAEWLESSLAGQ